MKKSLIITIGIILILLVLAAWAYLLFFGTPKNGAEVFAKIGVSTSLPTDQINETAAELPPSADEETITTINTSGGLNQLTTRPVAGFSFVGTSSTLIRYSERGTGHVYETDIQAGSEKKISGTTIPRVTEALFSESGDGIALVVEDGYTQKVLAGSLNTAEEKITYIELPSGAQNPEFMSENKLRYTVTTPSGTEGYEISVSDGTSARIFSIPLTDIAVQWGSDTYVHNSPSQHMTGAMYKVNSSLTPLTSVQLGLTGAVYGDMLLWSQNEDGRMISYARALDGTEAIPLAISFIPEKCTGIGESQLWCAAPFSNPNESFLESWYRGDAQSEDILWKVRVEEGQAQSVVNFLRESGRSVDVDMITTNETGVLILLRNKIDNSLWLYDARIN